MIVGIWCSVRSCILVGPEKGTKKASCQESVHLAKRKEKKREKVGGQPPSEVNGTVNLLADPV